MRFYVIYNYCSDPNEWGGKQQLQYAEYEMLEEAHKDIATMKESQHYSNIIGPLFLARSLSEPAKPSKA